MSVTNSLASSRRLCSTSHSTVLKGQVLPSGGTGAHTLRVDRRRWQEPKGNQGLLPEILAKRWSFDFIILLIWSFIIVDQRALASNFGVRSMF